MKKPVLLIFFLNVLFTAYAADTAKENRSVGKKGVSSPTNQNDPLFEGAIGKFRERVEKDGEIFYHYFAPKADYWPLFKKDNSIDEFDEFRKPANGAGWLYIYKLDRRGRLVWVRTEYEQSS